MGLIDPVPDVRPDPARDGLGLGDGHAWADVRNDVAGEAAPGPPAQGAGVAHARNRAGDAPCLGVQVGLDAVEEADERTELDSAAG